VSPDKLSVFAETHPIPTNAVSDGVDSGTTKATRPDG